MYSEKGICPNCGKGLSLKKRAINVNTANNTFVCRMCMKTFDKEEAKRAYQKEIDILINNAREQLFLKDDGPLSYKLYADIIDIDNKIELARYGRVLSLFFCSTLRKAMFDEVEALIENEKITIYHKSDDSGRYLAFIRILNGAIDKYMSRCKKALTINKKYFYDEDCLKLYLCRLSQTISLKTMLYEEAQFLSRSKEKTKGSVLRDAIEHSIEEYKILLTNVIYVTTSGNKCSLDRVKRNHEVLIKKQDDVENIDYSKYRLSSLDKCKEKRYIKDAIFKRNASLFGKKTIFLSHLVVSLFLCVGLAICTYLFRSNPTIMYLFIGGLSLFTINSIICLIFLIKYIKAISRRKKNLINKLNY